MPRKLDDRTALVTGAGRGIGREIALKLASEGARVVVNDLDDGPAQATVQTITEAGGQATSCSGSVVEDAFAERFVRTAVGTYGGVDIVVNNAGYTWDSVVQNMADEQFDAMIDVHVRAPFRILRAVQPVISEAAKAEKRRDGAARCRKVVNISSVSGTAGNSGQVNYAAAKAGITGVTKSLAKEWGRYNVTVNTVAFGLIETRLTAPAGGTASIEIAGRRIGAGVDPAVLAAAHHLIPLGRAGTPAEAAGAVYLLCSPESDYISAQTVVCGGGWSG